MGRWESFLQSGILLLVFLGCAKSDKYYPARISVDEAIKQIQDPIVDNQPLNFQNQAEKRLFQILEGDRFYILRKQDLKRWNKFFVAEKNDPYAKLIAAYFLLNQHPNIEARNYFSNLMDSKNVRLRFNAGKILAIHFRDNSSDKWARDLLLKKTEMGLFNYRLQNAIEESEFPLGDKKDLRCSPLSTIIVVMGETKTIAAKSLVLKYAKKGTNKEFRSAAFTALGKIGDDSCFDSLKEAIVDRDYNWHLAVKSLGELKQLKALPMLGKMLYEDGLNVKEKTYLIEAIGDIGTDAAVAILRNALMAETSTGFQTSYQLALVDLESADPVFEKIKMFGKEKDFLSQVSILNSLKEDAPDQTIHFFSSILMNESYSEHHYRLFTILRNKKVKKSLFAIAGVLTDRFSEQKSNRRRISLRYLQIIAYRHLCKSTGQDFEMNGQKWRQWISENVNM